MPAAPSYYDSIGLLAICDAIDAVEGIPFKPTAKPQPLPTYAHMNSSGPVPTSIPPPTLGKVPPPQHIYLSHIPVTGMTTPTGAISYEEQQRVAINQLASTGQLPQQMPPHTIGGTRPTISVAHNLGATNTGPRGTPSIPPSPQTRGPSPGFGAPPPGLHRVTASPNIRGGPGSLPPSKSASPGFTPGMSMTPQGLPPHGMVPHGMPHGMPPQGLSAHGMHQGMPQRMVQGGPMQSMPQAMPAGPPGMPPISSLDGPSLSSLSRASTPGGNPGSPTESPQPQGSEYRIEVCQICGRDFKGPKAATHKQQHIRRLHPTEYTPKRGGKKSRD